MDETREAVAAWMRALMSDKGWTAQKWAEAAGLAPTTITRALDPNQSHLTNIRTLAQLAVAADVPSVIDLLEGRLSNQQPRRLEAYPSEATLAQLLAALLPLVPRGRMTDQSLRVLAAALSRGLEMLGDHHSTEPSEDALSVAARGAAARFRDLLG